MNIKQEVDGLLKSNKFLFPLILRLKAFSKYEDNFRRIFLVRDILEIVVKYNVAISLGLFFHYNKEKLNEKNDILQKLERPMLGNWIELLKKYGDLSKYKIIDSWNKKEFDDFMKIATEIKNMRNDYAHGGVPSDEICSEDLEKYFPKLIELIKLNSLLENKLILTDDNEKSYVAMTDKMYEYKEKIKFARNSVFLQVKDNFSIDLFPILVFRPFNQRQELFFFNDYKNFRNVSLLNYELAVPTSDIDSVKNDMDKYFNIKGNDIRTGKEIIDTKTSHLIELKTSVTSLVI